MPRATSATWSKVTASSAAIASSGSMSCAEDDRLRGGVARDRVRVLEGEHAPPGGVGAGALDLLLARPVGAQLVDDLAHPRVGLDALGRVQARRELQDRHVGEASGRPRRRSRRGRAARGSRRTGASPSSRRAASSRRQRGALRRGRAGRSTAGRRSAGATGWSRAVSTSVCGANARRRLVARRRREIDGKRPNSSASSRFSGRCSRLPTRNAPPRAPAHWRRRKATIASRVNVRRCSSGPSTGRPSGWSPNAARSIRCSATTDGWSLRAGDLLDHDAALAVELLGVDLRAPDEVGQQVDRLAGHLGAAGDVERDEVVRRVGVEHRAHALGGLVDLAVVVVLLRRP